MAEMKHTTGPWTLFNDGKCVAGPESTAGAGHGVAMCSMRARTDEEARANAQLIAAAPDLLALAYQYRDDLHHPPTPDSRERRLSAIEAVLSKAGA
jgi:hypothetical protein